MSVERRRVSLGERRKTPNYCRGQCREVSAEAIAERALPRGYCREGIAKVLLRAWLTLTSPPPFLQVAAAAMRVRCGGQRAR
jgi:hypothetical protein